MLSKQEQNKLLQPFQVLVIKFGSALETAKETLNEWEKARTIKATDAEVRNNVELTEKITRLETGKSEIEAVVETVTHRSKMEGADFTEMVDDVESDLISYSMLFNEVCILYNHKYTVQQKNEINRRITVVNSSRMLNNADMEALQKQWTAILSMNNDIRLVAARKGFEERLTNWENLIAQKQA